jgi:hypothetical protein
VVDDRSPDRRVIALDAQTEGVLMYGVIVRVRINRGREDEMRSMMDEEVVPRARQLPGFAGGSWFQALEGDGGFAAMVFDSEETARGFAERVASQGPLADTPVWSVEGIGTYEVLARA